MDIKTSAKILKCFSDTESIQRKKEQFSRKQEDRTLNNILYCSTAGCADTFDETSKLKERMLPGKHSIPEQISSFDQVKKSFTEKMKLTPQQHHPTSSSTSTNPDGLVLQVYNNFFQQQGWALPMRKKYKFSIKQKKLLYEYFMQGETSGKKLSPDQVLAKNLISMCVMQ